MNKTYFVVLSIGTIPPLCKIFESKDNAKQFKADKEKKVPLMLTCIQEHIINP